MKKDILFISVLVVVFNVNVVFAEISGMAPSASHALERSSDKIHEYLHHYYDDSYGAHDFEVIASDLHHALHEWKKGELAEKGVSMIKEDLKLSWSYFKQNIHSIQLLYQADHELRALFYDVNKDYVQLGFLLKQSD